jgi:ABC-2 type transport system ATP-binding protein
VTVASIQNLTVRYGNFTALNDFSCEIPEGCTGLLGPNGAGKTTLIKTLLGFVQPASGGGNVLGSDIARGGREIRQKVGLMPEQDCHIPGMTAVGFVAYAGELAGMPADQALRRAHEVLEYCGLGEARYRNVETYSTGMKQRIKLAQALVHGPKLLLLDEPTNGLDPAGREDMLELVRTVSHGKGVNVLVSSHLLPDIERVSDRVIVVMSGQLRAQGTIRDLKKLEGSPVDVELRETSGPFVQALQARGLSVGPPKANTYRVQGTGLPHEVQRVVLQVARETGAQVRGFRIAERTLEEAFLAVLEPSSAAKPPAPAPDAAVARGAQ